MRLIHGEALEELDKLIDEGVKVDAIITDPPYGTTACKWDTIIPLNEMWEMLLNIIKDDGAIVLFGGEPFSSKLRISQLKYYKYDWKWEKPNGANFLTFKYQPARVHEDIMVFGKNAAAYSKNGIMKYNPQMVKGKPYSQISGSQRTQYNNPTVRSPIKKIKTENTGKRYPKSIQKFNRDKTKLHPTQKPVKLLEYLIKTYTNEGDTVLDFTMGSGTTGVACKKLNRDFIGIELAERYYNISKDRIEGKLTDKEIKEKYKG